MSLWGREVASLVVQEKTSGFYAAQDGLKLVILQPQSTITALGNHTLIILGGSFKVEEHVHEIDLLGYHTPNSFL